MLEFLYIKIKHDNMCTTQNYDMLFCSFFIFIFSYFIDIYNTLLTLQLEPLIL